MRSVGPSYREAVEARAEVAIDEVSDRLRAIHRRLGDALWDLDSARSLLRKAESGVYRSSPLTGDTTWDIEAHKLRVRACYEKALEVLKEIGA